MIPKGTPLYSILHFKCPYCQEGDFLKAHPYNLRMLGKLHERCLHCNGRFTIEPGFYFGAMYVSYALGMALAVAVWMAFLVLVPEVAPHWIIATAGVLIFVASPYIFALSRIIWANLFMAGKEPTDRSPRDDAERK